MPIAPRGADDVEVGRLPFGRGPFGIRGHVIQVELQRVRAGLLDECRVPGPARRRGGVEARDDRHRKLRLQSLDQREVAIAHRRKGVDGREVVERLGEVPGTRVERAVELDLFVENLLFEQRWHDDRRCSRVLHPLRTRELAVERRRRRDDRRAQVETEIPRRQIDHAESPCSYRYPASFSISGSIAGSR